MTVNPQYSNYSNSFLQSGGENVAQSERDASEPEGQWTGHREDERHQGQGSHHQDGAEPPDAPRIRYQRQQHPRHLQQPSAQILCGVSLITQRSNCRPVLIRAFAHGDSQSNFSLRVRNCLNAEYRVFRRKN